MATLVDTHLPDDFEVAVFLTEISSRHAILHKQKRAKTEKPRLGTNTGRLTGEGTRDAPLEVRDARDQLVLREDSQAEKGLNLADIPAAGGHQPGPSPAQDSSLFISDVSDQELREEDDPLPLSRKSSKRRDKGPTDQDSDTDDKKKIGMNTSYDGFSIYGRILCLVVKRRGNARGKDLTGGAGQAMMEGWIASTQMAEAQMMD